MCWTVQDQTGGNEDGLFVRDVWRPFPATRATDPVDRQAGPRRCGIHHVHLATTRHHLPPFYYPYLRDRVRTWRRVDGLGVHLGDHRLVARPGPLERRLHPAEPGSRGPGRVNVQLGSTRTRMIQVGGENRSRAHRRREADPDRLMVSKWPLLEADIRKEGANDVPLARLLGLTHPPRGAALQAGALPHRLESSRP